MNKKTMAMELASRTGLSQVKAAEVIKELFDVDNGVIANALASGDKVLLAGFGTFTVRERAARVGVKPGTTERIQIPAKKQAHFKPGTSLRDRLAG